MRLLTILLLLLSFTAHAQYDAPGPDPIHQGYPQSNAYSRVSNAATIYPFQPYRVEYYRPASGADTLAVTFTWDRNFSACTIRGGKMATSNQMQQAVPHMWQKGLTGRGVKIGVIDLGYSTSVPHASITVTKASNTSGTFKHSAGVISVIAARDNGLDGILGTAYDASMYSYGANYGLMEDIIDSARVDGCRILNISLVVSDTQPMRDAVKRFHDAGGIVILAGSDDSLFNAQQGCSIPWVVCVGGTAGGTIVNFTDSLKTPPLSNGVPNHFTLPVWTIAAGWDVADPAVGADNNLYIMVGGTSFAAPQLAGMFGVLTQKFPFLPERALYWMLRRHSRLMTSQGVSTYVPTLNFIR